MKKILSVLLALIMVVSTVSVCFADTVSSGIYPTIIVAGYSSSSLYNTDADGNISKIWGVDMDRIMALVLKNIARIGRGLGELAFGKPDTVADIVGQAIVDMYGIMAYDESGNSINNIDTFSHSAAETQFSYLKKEVNGEHMHEAYIMSSVCDIYEEKFGVQDGNDYIFSFQTDFRQIQLAIQKGTFCKFSRLRLPGSGGKEGGEQGVKDHRRAVAAEFGGVLPGVAVSAAEADG